MKNIKKSHIILAVAICAIIALNACKKKDSTPAPATYGTLLFHLHTNVDTNEVDNLGQVYLIRDSANAPASRRITVSKAQLYISSIQLEQSSGSWIAGPGLNVLKLQEAEEYTIGTAPTGNYQSVKFNVGLNAATNSTTPSSSDPTLYRKDMWFDSTNFTSGGGFVFVDFEGTIDTTATPSSSNPLIPFVIKIGTNANLKSVTLPSQNFTITTNQATEVHMIIDYAKLFKGVPLNQSSGLIINTAAENGSWSWAAVMANNISTASGMFYYEPGEE